MTGNEKWIHYSNPKRRKSWGLPGHASTSSFRPNIHTAKVMLCIWWDQVGVIYYKLLKPNETITGELYRTQLMRLSRALHEKVILQHDNAQPHVAKPVKTYLETLKWEVLPHPPYSPDIAPSDYYLFRSIAHGLADRQFRSYEDIKKWLDSWITSKDEHFYPNGIRALPERWAKVVANVYFKHIHIQSRFVYCKAPKRARLVYCKTIGAPTNATIGKVGFQSKQKIDCRLNRSVAYKAKVGARGTLGPYNRRVLIVLC